MVVKYQCVLLSAVRSVGESRQLVVLSKGQIYIYYGQYILYTYCIYIYICMYDHSSTAIQKDSRFSLFLPRVLGLLSLQEPGCVGFSNPYQSPPTSSLVVSSTAPLEL